VRAGLPAGALRVSALLEGDGDCRGARVEELLGPIPTRTPLLTETIPVGFTQLRVNEARLPAP